MKNIIVLDLETTGLNQNKDKIIEFAAVKLDNNFNEIGRIDFVCNPGISVPKTILNLTGISRSEIESAKSFEFYVNEIMNFIGEDDIIVGHNIGFDVEFLKQSKLELKNKLIDTFVLAGMFLPGFESYSLEVLTDLLKINHEYKHRAFGDVFACIEILKIVYCQILKSPNSFINEIKNISFNGSIICFIREVLNGTYSSDYKLRDFNITKKNYSFDSNIVISEKYSFEWNSKKRLIEKIYNFYNALGNKTVIINDLYFKDLLGYFLNDINIIKSSEGVTNLEKLNNYLNEVGFNDENEGLLLKIIYAKNSNLELSGENINLKYDDFRIWNKFFALNSNEINIKEKNLIQFSFWKKNKELFNNHKLLFIDPDFEEEDSRSCFGENFLIDRIENIETKEEVKKIFLGIKNILIDEFEMTQYGIYFEINNETKKLNLFSDIKTFLLKLEDIILKEKYLDNQKIILNNFLNNENFFNYINVDLNFFVTIYSLKINLLDGYENILSDAHFGFFSGSVNKNLDYQNKYFDINISKNFFEFDNFNNVKTLSTDINSPGGKHNNFTEFSYKYLKDLIIKNLGKRICILVKTKKQIEEILFFLNEAFDDLKILGSGVSGGNSKLIHMANSFSGGLVVVGNNEFFNKYLLSDSKKFDLGIIMKLPFDNPGGINNERMKKYQNTFNDFSLPRSIIQIKQFVLSSGVSEVFFMDNRVLRDSWAKLYIDNLKN